MIGGTNMFVTRPASPGWINVGHHCKFIGWVCMCDQAIVAPATSESVSPPLCDNVTETIKTRDDDDSPPPPWTMDEQNEVGENGSTVIAAEEGTNKVAKVASCRTFENK